MSSTITAAFIAEWSDDVHHIYQQKGSKLRDAVRVVTGVNASTYDFHKLASVAANTKSRGAEITALDPTHTTVQATLTDHYAGDYIDKLDQLKTNPDMRREYATAFANALGRKTDDLLITAINAGNGSTAATTAGGLTYAKILEVLEGLNDADVDPEDRFLVVGSKQLAEALNISQLSSADYMSVRNVVNGSVDSALGFKWVMSNRLPLSGSPFVRSCFGFSKMAVGLAIGQDVKTEINYIPTRVAHLVNSFMSMGAVVIDGTGVIQMECDE